MRKLLLLPGTVLAAAMLCTAVNAQQSSSSGSSSGGSSSSEGWHHHHHHHDGMWMVLKQLDLTDQQKASVKQILQTAHTTLQPQMQTLKADRLAFLEATPGSSAYDSAATTLAQAASAAAQARVQEEASVRTQIYGLLSGPQQSKLATLQAEWAQKAAQHASTSD